ncbi:MAG: chain-length determining protein [Prevotella sp.]|nr:chain-length determining protein [Prevotella sp.]
MNENNHKELETIDLQQVFQKIWQRKMLFAKVLPVVFILSCLYIICIPRTYTSDTKMAPEMENSMSGGTLGSIASSFGIDLGDMQTTDAITPLLYPDLMEDNKFVTDLFNIQVESQDGEIKTTYYEYLKKHQKSPWWNKVIYPIKKIFKPKEKEFVKTGGIFNPYKLSRKDDEIAGAVRNNITLAIDKKTGVISISTKSQDALICKTLADSVRTRLQAFITEYRTSKARTDLEYYKKLMEDTKASYERARRLYGSYADANNEVILESYRAKQNDLENDMQLKYNNYTAMVTQYQAAKAKVQERTPAFTMIKGASVPVKPTGPKRMMFVLIMLFLSFIATCGYILIKK